MILFWTLAVLMALAAGALIVLPLWRTRPDSAEQDLLALNRRVFRERLAELERDRAEGRTDEATFVELRTELERNMLTLDAPGAGSRFVVRLPAAYTQPAPEPDDALEAEPAGTA